MSSGNTLVSVVMPVHNSAAFLKEAITSILEQTHQNLELIVIDDGSTDESPDILRSWERRDARIKALFIDHLGAPAAANYGVTHAQGELIARMDSDDIAHHRRIELQVEWMKQNGLKLCGSQAELFGNRNELVWYPETHDGIGRELMFRVGLLHASLVIDGDILRQEKYCESAAYDDYELLTRCYGLYRMGNIMHTLIKRRTHALQANVIDKTRFKADRQRYRFRYFYDRFPKTPPREYVPLARLADGLTFNDVDSLEKAAKWLVRLSDSPDPLLRWRMARRWDAAHGQALAQGLDAGDLYMPYCLAILDGKTSDA